MTVWVSGARGKLGREVCRLLAAEGQPCVPADVVPDAAGRSVDLLDAAAVAASLRDCDAVIHCAAIPSPEDIEPVELVRINTLTTFTALEEAWRAGVRTAGCIRTGGHACRGRYSLRRWPAGRQRWWRGSSGCCGAVVHQCHVRAADCERHAERAAGEFGRVCV